MGWETRDDVVSALSQPPRRASWALGLPPEPPALSAVVGKVAGLSGGQLWAQVSAKAWPPHRFGGRMSTCLGGL